MTIRPLIRRRRQSDRFVRPSTLRPNVYIYGVIVAGLTLAVISGVQDSAYAHITPVIALFAGCVAIGELFPLRVRRPGAEGEITPSTTFAFGLVLVAGHLAVPLMALTCLACDRITGKPAVKMLFNAGQYAMTVWMTATVLSLTTGAPHLGADIPFTPGDLPGILLAGFVFFVANSLLVGSVIALLEQQSILVCLSDDLLFQATSAGLLLGLAPMVVISTVFSPLLLPLFGLPLLSIIQGQRQALLKEHEAIHDALTGLPNRVLFAERIEAAIRTAERDDDEMAVMILDLDGFKEINDTLGHHEGDRLLKALAQRLGDSVRDDDVVARLGGDEFGVLVPATRRTQATRVAEKLHAALSAPLAFDDLELEVGGSVGIALYPEHGANGSDLMKHADVAMYRAKREGHTIDFYDPNESALISRNQMAADLSGGLERGELEPFFQPKIELRTGRIVGVEALMRWQHPTRGTLQPAEFIGLAEQSGTIIRATELMLNAALEARAGWLADGHDLSVAVNLSPRSLLDRRLPQRIADVLARAGAPGSALELEITESMLMADPERATLLLEAIRDMGVLITIDDFGTGYSSLERIRRLPLDAVKIDRSFVIGMATDESDAVIVRSTIDLAQRLDLIAVAEGAENAEVYTELTRMGCDQAQGFHICPPLSRDEFDRWLSTSALMAAVEPVATVPPLPVGVTHAA
jgi:diguanylate cyclase (GGDEF)-like protein